MNLTTGLGRGLRAGLLASLVGNGTLFLWWAGSSRPWGIALPGSEFLILAGVGAAALVPVGLAMLISHRSRERGAFIAAAALLYAAAMPAALFGGDALRMAGFQAFSERAEPLVAAIRAYQARHGRPPEALSQLVPELLDEVPATGVGSAPDYRYSAGERVAREHRGNRWILWLPVGSGIVNWDRLFYYPRGNYPARFEPVGPWAYFHE